MAHEKLDAPIGVFDSGLGGLTVLRELMQAMPAEDLVYFGDTARVPYGSKSKETIIHYTEQILAFLATKNVKAIVAACNTVSAYALEEVRENVPVPIVGVVRPGARAAAAATKNGRIGVIGTEGTVRSGLYERCIPEERPGVAVFQKACPLLVPLVEEGLWDDPVTREMIRRYTAPLTREGIDTLILGCTHYPLLRPAFRTILGPEILLINPAYETAQETRRVLASMGLLRTEDHAPSRSFYVSDSPEKFGPFAGSVLSVHAEAEKIQIESF